VQRGHVDLRGDAAPAGNRRESRGQPVAGQHARGRPAPDLERSSRRQLRERLGQEHEALARKTHLGEKLRVEDEDRRQRAAWFIDSLKDYPELSFQKIPAGQKHAYHLLSARFDGQKLGKTRDDFYDIMVYRFGIKTIVQYYPLYRYPLFQKMGFGEANCPNTDEFFDNMVSFPFYHWLPEDKFEYMLEHTRQALDMLRG